MKSNTLQATAAFRTASTLVLLFLLATLVACGGTQVYSVDKTMTYRDSLYNMSSVGSVSPREEAKKADGDVVNLRNMDKKALQAFFKENKEVLVSMIVDMDDREMVYLRSRVNSYSEYSKMKKRFDNAMEDINDFMGDKKDTQLKLK